MSKHFTQVGDEYLLSPAAVLVVVADAVRSPDTTAVGKARARRVLAAVMQAARAAKYEQADILETMLAAGTEAPRLLAMCDALVKRIGAEAVVEIVRNCLGAAPQGDG